MVRQGGSEYEGVSQTVLPESGVAPTGTSFLHITWQLRNIPASGDGSDRRLELYALTTTKLGANGPRPWFAQAPYIGHVLGYVGLPVIVDLADAFDGVVMQYSTAGVPIEAQHGSRVTLRPNATRALKPPIVLYAHNEAGASASGAELYLQVDQPPAQLRRAGLDPDMDAQLIHQHCEPGDWLFAIDTDHLFADGLPPFDDSLEVAPGFVEMAAPGLVGGRCPQQQQQEQTGGGSITHEVVVQRVDGLSNTATARVNVTCLRAPRDRTPTHSPADGAALGLALKASGRRVIQLQPGVAYTGYGNLYGAFAESAAEPVLVVGAPGATLDAIRLDNVGHIDFDGVAFALAQDDTLVYAKKVRGLRLRNCTLEGFPGPVDFADGNTWMRNETYRWMGIGVRVRENSFAVLQGSRVAHLNRHLTAEVSARSLVVADSLSVEAANDHVFLQQSTAIWLDSVELLFHDGNHHEGEHRDCIQLANPNQPPIRKVLIRRVFGHCYDQGLFIENEDQRIFADRLPYWPGNHRSIRVEHSAFVANSAHGISVRGVLGASIVRSATFGDPDAYRHAAPSERARATMLIRPQNENVFVSGCLVEELTIEDARDFNVTSNVLGVGNVVAPPASLADLFPRLTDTAYPMRKRFELSSSWAAAHPDVGPDILRRVTASPPPTPALPSPSPPATVPVTALPPPTAASSAADGPSPSAPPPPAAVVTFSLRASGEVSDYTPAVLERIAALIATAAGVDASSVTIDVAAGSVLLSAKIMVASEDEAAVVTSTVAEKVATPAAATALLADVDGVSIVVQDIVSSPRAQPLQPSSPQPLASVTSANEHATQVAVVASVVSVLALTVLALAALLAYRRRGRKGGRRRASAPSAFDVQMSPCCYRLGRDHGGDSSRSPAAATPAPLRQKV